MTDWQFGLLLKPLIFIAVMIPVVLLGRFILSRLPEGRVKRLLSRRVGP